MPMYARRNAPLAHQRADDPSRRRVDRNREPEPDSRDGRVDPDDARPPVGERAPRVARIEGGVRLDDVVDDPAAAASAASDRVRDDAGSHGAREAVRVADRDDELPDRQQLVRVARARRPQVARVGPRTTARSDSGSVPTTSMPSSRPSTKEAVPSSAPSTTCAEVSRKPSGVITTPLPPPSSRRPRSRRETRRLATDGESSLGRLDDDARVRVERRLVAGCGTARDQPEISHAATLPGRRYARAGAATGRRVMESVERASHRRISGYARRAFPAPRPLK